jgi:hypothetical protein
MSDSDLAFLTANLPWLIALFVATLLGTQLERHYNRIAWKLKRKRNGDWKSRRPDRAANLRTIEPPAPKPFDPAEQLRHVERATFKTIPLLNRGEARLFGLVERVCAELAPDWRVMAQVSMGEILSSPSDEAYRAINSKRVDLLILGPHGHALHAIEYQGSGHHLGPAATRDAVKKEALRKAGVGYVEVKSGDTPGEVKALIQKLMQVAGPAAITARDSDNASASLARAFQRR